LKRLASISDYGDHFYLHLVESAPFNLGKKKLYVGVPGNLFAFTCKLSWDKGYEGFVAFQSKTKLVEHYKTMLGAVHVGGHKMIIFPAGRQSSPSTKAKSNASLVSVCDATRSLASVTRLAR